MRIGSLPRAAWNEDRGCYCALAVQERPVPFARHLGEAGGLAGVDCLHGAINGTVARSSCDGLNWRSE